MNNILEMIKNEKVEWKKLGDVCEIGTGKSNTNQQVENGKYPFYVRSKDIKRIDEYEFDEEAIIIPGEGGIGEIYHYINGKYALHQRAYRIHVLKDYIKSKYVYYYMQAYFYNFILKSAVGSTVSSIRKGMIENFEIPIPSLKTQERIVKILDTMVDHFTQLEAELEAELEARNKQYEYYRDKLLSEEYLNKLTKKFGGSVEQVTLGDIGIFTRGNGLQKKDFRLSGKPVIHYGQIYTTYGFSTRETYFFAEETIYSKLRKAKKNDILIATTSENVEDLGKPLVWLGDEEVGFSGDMYSFSTDENSKYIAYFFQSVYFQKIKDKICSGTKVMRIHDNEMRKVQFFLPPIEVQNTIVDFLDRFQAIIQDVDGLLPKEIELRHKQYEYYRERLLDFKRDDNE